MSTKMNMTTAKKKLLNAVKHDHLDDIKQLLDYTEIKIDKTYFDHALLKAAFKRKHKSLINLLLEKNFRTTNPNESNCDTLLHYAVKLEDTNIIQTLMKAGAFPNDLNSNEETPVIFAVTKLHLWEQKIDEIVDSILSFYNYETKDTINEQDLVHFYIACDRGISKTVKKLVEYNRFPVNGHAASSKLFNWNGNTPLHFAVAKVKSPFLNDDGLIPEDDLITYLLKQGADYALTNIKKQTPIHLAFYNLDTTTASTVIQIIFEHSFKNECINSVDKTGLTHFHICCAVNVPEVVEKFLKNGEDINSAVSLDSDTNAGYTSLHFAVENRHKHIVGILLNHGANVSLKCKNGFTPLHLACHFGHTEIAALLMQFSASLTEQDNVGCTPLHCAFYEVPLNHHIDYLLTQTSKDINYTDSEGLSVFHIACTRKDTQIIVHFLEHGISPNLCTASSNKKYPSYSALHFAVEYNRYEIVKLLFEYGADPNITENNMNLTALHISCMHNHKKFYEFLNLKNFDWTQNYKNHIKIIKLLLDNKAEVNAKDSLDKTPLICLCELDKSPLIKNDSEWKNYFKLKTTNIEELFQVKKIFQEVEKRIIDIASILLSNNANINACKYSGKTILHVISKDTQLTVAEELAALFLKNKANIQLADMEGFTPLHIAVQKKKYNLVKIFINYGANINAKTTQFMTPLLLAANDSNSSYYGKRIPKSGNLNKIVKLLLQNGCCIDSQNLKGETALHCAISQLNYPIVSQLLCYGADINLENAYGDPPVLNLKKVLNKWIYSDFAIKSMLKNLNDHVKKLEIIGFHTSVKTKKFLSSVLKINGDSYEIEDDIMFLYLCESELEEMKSTKVDQYTNLYNILFKNDIEMSRLVQNKRLKTILAGKQSDKKFPQYGEMLKLRFQRGTEKVVLLDNAKKCLNYVTGLILPDLCSEKIFKYLTNDDLYNLIQVKPAVSHKRKVNFDPKETSKSTAKQRRIK